MIRTPTLTLAAPMGIDTARALCADPSLGLDPEMWFPDPTSADDRERARAVCALCPVRDECENFGRDNRLTGIWGRLRPDPGPRHRPVIREHCSLSECRPGREQYSVVCTDSRTGGTR